MLEGFDWSRPKTTPFLVGVAIAVLIVGLMMSARCSETPGSASNSAPPPPAAAPAPRAPVLQPSLSTLRTRLLVLAPNLPPSKLAWSPVVRDADGPYRAVWFSQDAVLRADVAADDGVQALSLTAPMPADGAMLRRYADLMLALVGGSSATPQDLQQASKAMAAILADGKPSSIDVAGVRFVTSSDLVRFVIKATPTT